jgi:effector-binding domain-containing protein
MKKKVIGLLLLLIIFAACFIPVTQQKNILVKTSFLNIYSLLVSPVKWEEWRPDLKKFIDADSSKISIQKDSGSFIIKYGDLKLDVKSTGNSFDINEHSDNNTINYNYTLLPDKAANKTLITVNKKNSAINYLIGKLKADPFSDTHITDLKNFVETDSLLYGCKIFKTRVPVSNLIVIKREVLSKNKFTEAKQMFDALTQYVKTHDVKQVRPLIAQFLRIGKDSAQVNVGFFIDKEVTSDKVITFTRMPKGGPLYSTIFRGEFSKRQKAYNSLHQYFIDHRYQSAILPFETYLDNKLPASDTDSVNILVNFSTYF